MEIIAKLKKEIQSHKKIYFLAKILKSNKDYLKKLEDLEDASLIHFYYNPKFKNTDSICVVECNCDLDGFFASLRWALDGLYFCDIHGLNPVVKFSSKSIYFDKDMPPDMDPFEYYFAQPNDICVKNIKCYKSISSCTHQNCKVAEALNDSDVVPYEYKKKYIKAMAIVVSKYIRLNTTVQTVVEKTLEDRGIGPGTLGVHIRGTDYKENYKNHPKFIPLRTYFKYIDEAMESGIFHKIYVATDDEEMLDEFLHHYGRGKILYSKDTFRGSGMTGIHVNNGSEKRSKHQFLLGLEVLLDMYCLVNCDGLISGLSQVGLMSRIFKESYKQNYKTDIIINLGINNSGKYFKKP